MAAEPSTGRATQVERSSPPEADAARALFERHSGQLYGFCLNRLGSREEAEDAVQTTFLNAFRGLQRGVVPEAEAAWLFKIAENVCLTRRRSAWRRGRVESPSDMQILQEVTPARQIDRGDELIPLGDALAAMPESQRRAILLREWQGLSYKEISDEMSVSQSAVETLIFRARRSLANALETPWDARRDAAQAGRRAFDLGSLLAGLKTLFAGGAAAKVAVVAVAATGTAALVVADVGHRRQTKLVEPSPAAALSPDSSLERSDFRRLDSTPADVDAPKAGRAAISTAQGRGAVNGTAPTVPAVAPSSRPGDRPAQPASSERPRDGESPGAASPPALDPQAGEPTASSAAAPPPPRTSVKRKVKPRPKPKPAKANARPKPKPVVVKATPKPSAEKPEKPENQKPAPAATAPPPPPPPPSPPSEKDKEKPKGE